MANYSNNRGSNQRYSNQDWDNDFDNDRNQNFGNDRNENEDRGQGNFGRRNDFNDSNDRNRYGFDSNRSTDRQFNQRDRWNREENFGNYPGGDRSWNRQRNDWESSRNYGGSNYGGGNYSSRDFDNDRNRNQERGWWDRTRDEVSSWFGDDDAQRRRQQDERQAQSQGVHRGRGPKGYTRSDDRIKEDINDRLSDDQHIDASDIIVNVSNGEVVLTGNVQNRQDKRRAEDLAEAVSGVKNVENRLRIGSNQGSSGNQGNQYTSGVTGSTNTGSVTGSSLTGNTGLSSSSASTSNKENSEKARS